MSSLLKLLIITLLSGLTFISKSSEINNWIMEYIDKKDKILCEFISGGDYFFISRNEREIKTGYRVNLTGENGLSKSAVVGWGFKDKNNQQI